MFKRITPFIALFIVQFSFSQSIDVNPTGLPQSIEIIPELINGTLTDNCSEGQNITYRYCDNVSSSNQKSFGYFTNTNPNFPFEEGIILSTGNSLTAEGPNPSDGFNTVTGNGSGTWDETGTVPDDPATPLPLDESQVWLGDADMKEILDDRFQDDLATNDATLMEFDFVPLTDNISFDYLFASEEWDSGTNECPGSSFQDGFAFIISGPGITPDLKVNGTPFAHGGKNIALIPGTNIPVSAGTIYNNPGCTPPLSNETLYVSYTGANAAGSPINFNARTVKLTAQSPVVAGQTYHLKLVVADRGDSSLDSAVFLAANSFTTAPVLTINGVEVGDVQPVCQGGGQSVTIDGTMNLPGLTGAVTYQWSHQPIGAPVAIDMTIANGYAQDENNATLTTNVNGTYTLTATLPLSGGSCDTVDSATITFLPDTTIGTAPEMRACDTGNGTASFPINNNDTVLLNGQDPALYSVSYHANQADADSGAAPITSPYVGVSNEIFARVVLTADPAFCFATSSFNVIVDTVPTATQPANPIIRICDDLTNGVNQESFDLTQFETEILNGQLLTDVSVSYFDNSTTPPTLIANATAFISGTNTIGVTIANGLNPDCTASTTFEIITDLIPVAIQPVEMRACDDEDAATGDIIGEETFDLTTQNEAVLGGPIAGGGLDPALYTVTYHWVDNTNPTTPVDMPIADPTAHTTIAPALSQEIFATVSNNANTDCTTVTSFFIFRDPIYTTAVPSVDLNLTECDYNNTGDLVEVFDLNAQAPIILGQGVPQTDATVTFYIVEADAIANTVANAITVANADAFASTTTNIAPFTQTIYYTISNNDNVSCYSTGSLELRVDGLPDIIAPTEPFQECDLGIIDGFTDFDFAGPRAIEIINGITQGNTTYAVSFFTNATDAQNNTNAIPTLYTNQANQTVHVRIEDTVTTCVTYTTLDLEVMTAPQAFPFDNPITYCDTDNDSFGYFDLNSIVSDVIGNIPGVDIVFYETEAEANLGVGAIDTSILYENVDTDGDGLGSTQTIYAELSSNGLDCVTLIEINLLVINSPVLPSEPLIYAECETIDDPDTTPFDESLDGIIVFDLTSYEETYLYSEIIDAAGGDVTVTNQYTATYYTQLDASGNADPAFQIGTPNAYENETTPDQIIYVVVTHTGDGTAAGTGCSIQKPITLHVDLLPIANHIQIEVCDDDLEDEVSDGQIEFNLLDYISLITDGATGVTVEFYETEAAAEAGLGIAGADFIATPEAYINLLNNPQAIFARVLNPISKCDAIAIVNLHVNPNPTPLSNQQIVDTLGNEGVMEECDGNVDGSGAISEQVAEFDLTEWEIAILNGESGVSAGYYTSFDDAAVGANAIANPTAYTNTVNPQTIYVSVINDGFGINPITDGTGCYTIVEFQLFVPVPEVSVVADKEVICVDAFGVPLSDTSLPLLTATAGPQNLNLYNYQWSLNGVVIAGATSQTLEASVPGDYTVTVSGPTDLDCITVSQVVSIEVSGVPQGYDANVTTLAFADSHQVVAEAISNIPGVEFWYSLDGGVATMDGTFTDVSPGFHTVTITDGEGCWSQDETVTLIDYPHFFTPNGDGINDTWAIIGQEGIPISQIYIFDRFGKLLSQIDPDGAGWDGTYNGNQMPGSDYWFKIIYIEGANSTQKEFKAHFSLKR